jgi:hypothetical protein
MDPVAQAASRIIKEQQAIIGPVALDQAKKVQGFAIANADDVRVTGNKKQALESLVKQFEKLFGKASVQVCKDAFEPFSSKIEQADIPDILKN